MRNSTFVDRINPKETGRTSLSSNINAFEQAKRKTE
jgi:hypothetical protein